MLQNEKLFEEAAVEYTKTVEHLENKYMYVVPFLYAICELCILDSRYSSNKSYVAERISCRWSFRTGVIQPDNVHFYLFLSAFTVHKAF